MVRQEMISLDEPMCSLCRKAAPSDTKEVEHHGVRMVEGWSERIIAAQKLKTICVAGKRKRRIPFGSEEGSELPHTTQGALPDLQGRQTPPVSSATQA
jgi:hypothetical protein